LSPAGAGEEQFVHRSSQSGAAVPAPAEALAPSSAEKLATWVSDYLSPPYTAVPVLLTVAYASSATVLEALKWSFFSLIMTLLPVYVFVQRRIRSGKLSDKHLSLREERTLIYFVSGLALVLCMAVMAYLHAPVLLLAAFAATLASSLVAGTINLFWKISVHAGSISGSVTLLIIVIGARALPTLLLVALVCWSRVVLHRHTVGQVTAGVALVSSITILVFRAFEVAGLL
jgi:membrane-associated phospholipid phosphatase